jgi:hypothetical protein
MQSGAAASTSSAMPSGSDAGFKDNEAPGYFVCRQGSQR